MEEKKFLVGTIFGSLILILGAVMLLSKMGGGEGGRVKDALVLVRDDSHSRGDINSRVTIVEFSDFQCPACKNAKAEVDRVLKGYGDKVRFVYRHYPLVQIHKYAQKTSEASEFADKNGKFWEWYDLVFEKQEEWSNVASEERFLELLSSYAKSLGLNEKELLTDLKNGVYKERVNKDVSDGNLLRISATPTFFVNGEETNGYRFDEFKKLIEKNLK